MVNASTITDRDVRREKIIDFLLGKIAADGNPLATSLLGLSRVDVVRQIFLNGRGRRLTDFGLQVMKCYVSAHDVRMPDGYRMQPGHLLFIDKNAVLPYHYSATCLVLFERAFAVRLRLVEGKVQTLIDIAR